MRDVNDRTDRMIADLNMQKKALVSQGPIDLQSFHLMNRVRRSH